MKRYVGVIEENRDEQVYVEQDSGRKELNPAYHLRNHSPDGFAWGYAGSGPAQLAIAILVDHLSHDKRQVRDAWPFKGKTVGDVDAERFYQRYKAAVIQHLPQDEGFTITSDEVETWLRAQDL